MTVAKKGANALRIALFSGNYNCVRDGANQALNTLAAYVLSQGAALRIYSPTVPQPAFEPSGDLVGVPAYPFPFGRGEYHLARGMPTHVRKDLEAFAPNIVHVSAPYFLGHRAVSWARERGIHVVASVHTLFETYPAYYGLAFLERPLIAILRRFYNRCDALVVPCQEIIDRLRAQGVTRPMSIWARGVDHDRFNPERRDLEWRRASGIADDDLVIGFLGRLVLEKGLDIFAAVCAELRRRGIAHKVLVVGDGPARESFATDCPDAIMVGFQAGAELGRAVAAMDIFLNPSITEAFGNVTLEAMAAGVAVVAADATGARTLIADGINGHLVEPRDVASYADAIEGYANDRMSLRAAQVAGRAASLDFEWDAINQKVVDVYQSLVSFPR
ncbi:MAG: glycosyltransferase family 1 protein [Sphingopyxis sp.]